MSQIYFFYISAKSNANKELLFSRQVGNKVDPARRTILFYNPHQNQFFYAIEAVGSKVDPARRTKFPILQFVILCHR